MPVLPEAHGGVVVTTMLLTPATVCPAPETAFIPALSVRQSWAGLIAAGFKPTENRTWAVPRKYLGARVWIHASAGKFEPAPLRPDFGEYEVPERLRARGRILALATLADCHLDAGCCRPWGQPGCFHWSLTDVRALSEPVPAKGALGLWKPPVALAAEVLGQLAAAAAHERLRNVSDIWAPYTAADDLLIQGPTPWRPTKVGVAS